MGFCTALKKQPVLGGPQLDKQWRRPPEKSLPDRYTRGQPLGLVLFDQVEAASP